MSVRFAMRATLGADGARDEAFAKALRSDVNRRRKTMKEILQRERARELRVEIDADLAIAFLLGAVQYRLMITGASVTRRTVEAAVDQALRGIAR
jgi:hypothetical protein